MRHKIPYLIFLFIRYNEILGCLRHDHFLPFSKVINSNAILSILIRKAKIGLCRILIGYLYRQKHLRQKRLKALCIRLGLESFMYTTANKIYLKSNKAVFE